MVQTFLYYLALTIGGTRGAIEDPLVQLLMVVAVLAALLLAPWWSVGAAAVIFNVYHIVHILPWWRSIGIADTWPDKAIFLLWTKLLIGYAVYFIVRGLMALWRRYKPARQS